MSEEGDSDTRVLVLGIGNPDRGDDGIGPLVIECLAGRLPCAVDVRVRAGDVLALIDDWTNFQSVIVVDAAASIGAPGRVHRIDALHETLPMPPLPASSHAFGLTEALALAQALGSAPAEVVVYAIEGEAFEAGAAMTPKVRAAARGVADKVATDVRQMLRPHAEAKSHA